MAAEGDSLKLGSYPSERRGLIDLCSRLGQGRSQYLIN